MLIEPLDPGAKMSAQAPPPTTDFAEIQGQEHAKRAFEAVAAGPHNSLSWAHPRGQDVDGARAMPGILPQLTLEEALEVTRIYSVADALPLDTPLIQTLTSPRAPPHDQQRRSGGEGTVAPSRRDQPGASWRLPR